MNTNVKPWRCALCGTQQEQHNQDGRTWYSNADWYRVALESMPEPVHIDGTCFREREGDRKDYDGTRQTSAWRPLGDVYVYVAQ